MGFPVALYRVDPSPYRKAAAVASKHWLQLVEGGGRVDVLHSEWPF